MRSSKWPKNVHFQPRQPKPHAGLHQKKRDQQGEGGDPAPLPHSHETPPGALSPASEECGVLGVIPEKHTENQRILVFFVTWSSAVPIAGTWKEIVFNIHYNPKHSMILRNHSLYNHIFHEQTMKLKAGKASKKFLVLSAGTYPHTAVQPAGEKEIAGRVKRKISLQKLFNYSFLDSNQVPWVNCMPLSHLEVPHVCSLLTDLELEYWWET